MKSLKGYIDRFKSSKDGKTLASNMLFLTLLQVASYLFPLITMPYLARVIGPEGFGKIAFANAIIVWIHTVADWGFNYTATRDVAKNRDNKERVSELFSTVLWARCVLALLGLIVLIALILVIPKFKENALIILFAYLLVPGHILYPEWFFQAIEKMKYITIFGVLIKLIFTLSVFIFIREPDDYIIQPLLVSFGYLCSGIISLYFIICKWGIKIKTVSLKQVFASIKGSTDVFINNLMPNLYNSLSVILLGMFGTPAQTGFYDAGKKFTTLANSAMSVVARVFFPFLSRRIDKHDLYVKFSMICVTTVAVVLFATAQWLIPLFFGNDFIESVNVLRITSIAVIFVVMAEVYGTNYLIVNNYDKLMRNITLVASLSGFVAAFPLIYYFNYIGAAITYTLSSFLLGLLSFIYARKYKNKVHSN